MEKQGHPKSGPENPEKENKILKTKVNLLLDEYEKKEEELKKRNDNISSLEEAVKRLQEGLKEKEAAKTEEKEGGVSLWKRIERFFDRMEGLAYRLWSIVWTIVIGLSLTVLLTIILNAEIREQIMGLFRLYILGR